MVRTLLALVGVLELLIPGRVVAAAERIALKNPDECELRGWTLPMARLEAIVFLLLAARGDSQGRLRTLLALVCGPAAVFPRQYVDIGAWLAYTEPERCEWKAWVVPVTRVMGIVYVLAALGARHRPDGDE